jgi:hypothetical protein
MSPTEVIANIEKSQQRILSAHAMVREIMERQQKRLDYNRHFLERLWD